MGSHRHFRGSLKVSEDFRALRAFRGHYKSFWDRFRACLKGKRGKGFRRFHWSFLGPLFSVSQNFVNRFGRFKVLQRCYRKSDGDSEFFTDFHRISKGLKMSQDI